MKQNSRLYDALKVWLGQDCPWAHRAHLTTCLWMVAALIQTGSVNLSIWIPYLLCRGLFAQSKQRRVRRWLGNSRINVHRLYKPLIQAALSDWTDKCLCELRYVAVLGGVLPDSTSGGASGPRPALGLASVEAQQRKQHRYETAHAVVRTGAKNIFVEKLNLAGLKKRNKAKTGESGKFLPNGQASKSGLNKSWFDAAFGMFLETLSVVAAKAGATVHKVNPAYTSKVLCYENKVAFETLNDRDYWDAELGLMIDRDINAALNIKQRGLQVFPVPKKVSKRKGLVIVRDLELSTVTTMVMCLDA